MDEDADQLALAALRNGDRAAFIGLVVRYQRPIYNAAFWILHRAEDASDVTQTVFLRVFERLDDYDPRYKFFSWLYRIAVNEAIDLHRHRGHEAPLDDEFDLPDGGGLDPEARLVEAEQAARLRRAMKQLSTKDRAVLTLRHFAELDYEAIGEVLEIDEKTVKSRLFDARRRLRALLEDEGPSRWTHAASTN